MSKKLFFSKDDYYEQLKRQLTIPVANTAITSALQQAIQRRKLPKGV